MLFGAKQIARSANGKVAHGDFEAGAQLCEFLNRLQALLGYLSKHLVTLVRKISIGNPVGASYPSTQLVELGQPHFVSIMDNQCIDVRDIHPGLDDTGADQHIVFSIEEVKNSLLQL
ncbi:hypothetical protein D3C75_792480 [compost metagenome]